MRSFAAEAHRVRAHAQRAGRYRRAASGGSSLESPPYHVVIPEVNLPLPDTGKNVLMLLNSNYWPLRDFILSIYPGAKMELVNMLRNDPHMRIVFINKIAAPVVNKMFECGMIP